MPKPEDKNMDKDARFQPADKKEPQKDPSQRPREQDRDGNRSDKR